MWGTVGGADGANGANVVRCGRTRAHASRGTGQGVRARGRRTPRAGHHPGGAMVRAERWSRGTGAVRWDVRAQRGTSRATPRGGAVEHEPSGGFRCADVLWCWWYAAVGRGPRVGTRGRPGHGCTRARMNGRTGARAGVVRGRSGSAVARVVPVVRSRWSCGPGVGRPGLRAGRRSYGACGSGARTGRAGGSGGWSRFAGRGGQPGTGAWASCAVGVRGAGCAGGTGAGGVWSDGSADAAGSVVVSWRASGSAP